MCYGFQDDLPGSNGQHHLVLVGLGKLDDVRSANAMKRHFLAGVASSSLRILSEHCDSVKKGFYLLAIGEKDLFFALQHTCYAGCVWAPAVRGHVRC